MNRIELKINDDKSMEVVTAQVLVEGENRTTEIALIGSPASWVGSAIRALITTPTGTLVDAVDASVPVPLTNTMLSGKGTLYVEYVAMKDGTEIARTKSPALLPVSAARSIIGDIDPAPLPDLVAEMVAAKGDCDSAAAAAVLATERIEATDADIKAAEAIREAERLKWVNATAQATTLEPDELATASVTDGETGKVFSIGVPRGETGATGATGGQGIQGIQGPAGGTWTNAAAIPLADEGGYYPTDNVEAALQQAAKRMESDEGYNITPLASLTVSSNKSVAVTAVDLATGTFTSEGHSLINGDNVYPVLNLDAGAVYLIDKIPGGLVAPTTYQKYYVVNKQTNTFQLSLSSGGAAVTFTSNANMDLTKWHFEIPISSATISGLPPLTKCRIEVIGRSIVSGQGKYVRPTGIPNEALYVVTGSNVYSHPVFSYDGDVFVKMTALIDYSDYLTIRAIITKAKTATANTNAATLSDTTARSMTRKNSSFTSVLLETSFFANGTKIEVYKM